MNCVKILTYFFVRRCDVDYMSGNNLSFLIFGSLHKGMVFYTNDYIQPEYKRAKVSVPVAACISSEQLQWTVQSNQCVLPV